MPIKKYLILPRMVQFTDSDFNKDFAGHYSLLFQLEEQQYSYAVYEKRKGKLQVLRTVTFNSGNQPDAMNRLKVSMTSDDILQAPFQEVRIGIVHAPFTLVPRVLFDEQLAQASLSLSASVPAGDHVAYNQVRGVFIKNIFSVPAGYKQFLEEVFQSPKWYHAGTALLESATRNKDQFADQQLVLDIKPGVIHLLYYEKKELLFMNQFRYVNKDDFLYYVLMIAEQYGVDRDSCDLKLSGEIVPDSQLFGELWKFFRNISFLAPNEHIVLPGELQEQPMYMFNTLLSLDLCE